MVDNRSAGFFGIGGSFNFKSGDISGTAAKTQDDKMGQGGEYFAQQKREDDDAQPENKYMDQSAVLRATLNSLAMMNVADVINAKKKKITLKEKSKEDIDEKMKKIEESLTVNTNENTEDEDFY